MKVQVIMSDELVKRLDKQAKRRGLSRSAYCAAEIVEGILFDEMVERSLLGSSESSDSDNT